jgi:hypothetical protein
MRAEFCWAASNDRLLPNLPGILKITCFKALESIGVKLEDEKGMFNFTRKYRECAIPCHNIYRTVFREPKMANSNAVIFLTTIMGHYKLAICMTTIKSDKFRGNQGR